jgi:hypothetical protein
MHITIGFSLQPEPLSFLTANLPNLSNQLKDFDDIWYRVYTKSFWANFILVCITHYLTWNSNKIL